ncbi:MAG TPA: hypothetical protein VN540_01105, partial [Clostridia bacterium]|nr:hypothetical protein [Clostridia bacterium]
VLTVLALVLALVPAVAFAATTNVADATGLAAALAAASPGDTIRLTANIDASAVSTFTINKAIIVDLNGFNVTGKPTSYTAFTVTSGGELGLANSSPTQSRLLIGTGDADEAYYEGIRIAAGKATVGTDVSIETGCPVFIYGDGTPDSAQLDVLGRLVVSAALPSGDAYAAIQGNGSAGKGGTVINIWAAEILNPFSSPLYIPQDGVVNIFGGTITGKTSAIAIKSGTLNIFGGTLRATGPSSVPTTGFSDGVNASGCAIQIESNDAYSGNVVLNITGGTIISDNAYALYEYLDSGNAASEVNGIGISGGSFQSAASLPSDFLISSELDAAAGRPVVTGGMFSGDPSAYVAALTPYVAVNTDELWVVGNDGVVDAIEGASAGDTVRLFGNLTVPAGGSLIIPEGVVLTKEGDIHNYGTIRNNGTITGTGTLYNYGVLYSYRGYEGIVNEDEGDGITVYLDKAMYRIDIVTGAGGTSTPYSPTYAVVGGSSVPINFTPNSGYVVADVKVDGVSIGAVRTYTFTNVQANHKIEVTFAKAGAVEPPQTGDDVTLAGFAMLGLALTAAAVMGVQKVRAK